jgi:hypothetical protein
MTGLILPPAVHALLSGWALRTVLFLSAAVGLSAQELTLLGGVMNSAQTEQSSYSWQVDYRQDFHRNAPPRRKRGAAALRSPSG